MDAELWRHIAARQDDLISWAQLRQAGVTRATVRHRLASGRWARRSDLVLSTTTGQLTARHRIVVRASAWELRDEPESVAEDLRALGVGRSSA